MTELLTLAEFAALIKRSPGAVHQMRLRGQTPDALKVGGRVMFRADDVESWLERQREGDQRAS